VGRRAALERGVKFGRPIKMTEEQLKLARKLLKQGKSIGYVSDTFFWGGYISLRYTDIFDNFFTGSRPVK
jgi:hypothetical protein